VNRQKKLSLVGLFFLAAIFIASVFQNCAKVNYQAKLAEPTTNIGKVVTKNISINPAFNPQSADMKILIVVDDSYTMSQSQTQLANALDSLLNPLQGRNVEFKIVSTSGIPDNQIDYDISTTNLSATTIQNTITNSINGRHSPLRSLQSYNTTQFQTLKNQVKASILSVGTNGSNTEEGFCAAARQLFDNSANSFFKAGDKAAVIFLTDENDASSYSTCLSSYKQTTSNSQVVYYNYLQKRARITLEYQVDRDGIISWYPVTWGIPLASVNNFASAANCSSADLNATLNQISTLGYTVRNVSTCVYETAQANYYGADLGDNGSVPTKNLCNSTVTYNNQTYSNFYSFVSAAGFSAVSTTCTKQTVASNSVTAATQQVSVIESDVVANQTQDLRAALINKSNELFGTGFIFASIFRRNGESCALQSGQSYGAQYEQLTSNLGSNAVAESLCATSFSNILSNVSTFITNVANRSYIVPNMADDESIFSVGIRRNNTLTVLTSNQFEAVGSTVTLTNFILQQGDVIEVTYGK
jgi:hypothetical protein